MYDEEEFEDDPTDDLPEFSDLMHQLLESHRETPDEAGFLQFPGVSIEDMVVAYRNLADHGLMEYTNDMVIVDGQRKHTLQLTRQGL